MFFGNRAQPTGMFGEQRKDTPLAAALQACKRQFWAVGLFMAVMPV